jgi:hypothetical protein
VTASRARNTDVRSDESGRAATGCLVFGVGIGLCLAVVLAVVISRVRHDIAPPPPNPAPFARSVPVRQADRADGEWMDAQFRTLQRFAPWLRSAGRSVLDVCSVAGSGGGLIYPGTGFGVSCGRTDSRYYAYGGRSNARIRQLKLALSRLGWGSFRPVVAVTQSRLPVVGADAVATSPPSGVKPGLEFSWAGRADQLSLRFDLGVGGPRVAPRRNYYVQTLRPGLRGILTSLSAAHPHLLIVSISLTYAHKGQLQVS